MAEVTFKLEAFEGPLDLLLHLISKNKVSITDIPITLITEQYMDYLNQMKRFDMEITGEFLVMAAQLLYIKSKMLLPNGEEEEKAEDPRAELVDRLIEYAKYKDAVGFLSERQFSDRFIFYKSPDKIAVPKVKYIETEIPISRLIEAYQGILERQERRKPIKKEVFDVMVKREIVPVSDRIKHIYAVFKEKDVMTFEELFGDAVTRPAAVSTFLAILELIRRSCMLIDEDESGKLLCRLIGDEYEFDTVDSDY